MIQKKKHNITKNFRLCSYSCAPTAFSHFIYYIIILLLEEKKKRNNNNSSQE
jgi:hypothetical protein